jgi:hypothetical protein
MWWRVFIELRALLKTHEALATKVHALERKVSVHERNIAQLADARTELLATPAGAAQTTYRVRHARRHKQQEDFTSKGEN